MVMFRIKSFTTKTKNNPKIVFTLSNFKGCFFLFVMKFYTAASAFAASKQALHNTSRPCVGLNGT